MDIIKFFKDKLKKKEVNFNDNFDTKIESVKNQTKEKKEKKPFETLKEYEIDGDLFKVGDKVICRTNEPYPLIIGKIIEFWNKEGKWEKAIPVVRNLSNGKKFNVHGIVKPYSEELLNTLKPMKPLEQWNYFVPEEVRYTEEEILKKEEAFKKREKFLPNKK